MQERQTATNGPNLLERIEFRAARIGIVGLGYVGLPLAIAAANAGFKTHGFDVDPQKPAMLTAGRSYIDGIAPGDVTSLIRQGLFSPTTEFNLLADCDVVIICVPTPLTRQREPDLSFVEATARMIAANPRDGQLVVLESTTYPGTTREIVRPILESDRRISGRHFFLAFSPEREDPGNRDVARTAIPKIVSGDEPMAATLAAAFYGTVVEKVIPVSTTDTAEAVKITENIFRAVNVALVNELKLVFTRMGIDIWEVIEAAKTKPFGFMPFYPGPGLGGHCIPIDPFYLTWKSREFDVPTRFIELAGEINAAMPSFVINRLQEALDHQFQKSLGSARVLLIGLAYKKNVSDVRESPSFKLWSLMEERGTHVEYHDAYVPSVPLTREYSQYAGRESTSLSADSLAGFDAVIIATDHDDIDYVLLSQRARLIIDTRNAIARHACGGDNVLKA